MEADEAAVRDDPLEALEADAQAEDDAGMGDAIPRLPDP